MGLKFHFASKASTSQKWEDRTHLSVAVSPKTNLAVPGGYNTDLFERRQTMSLSAEQAGVVASVCSDPRNHVIQGVPGAGKSTVVMDIAHC